MMITIKLGDRKSGSLKQTAFNCILFLFVQVDIKHRIFPA